MIQGVQILLSQMVLGKIRVMAAIGQNGTASLGTLLKNKINYVIINKTTKVAKRINDELDIAGS